jgi:hypothetical protein
MSARNYFFVFVQRIAADARSAIQHSSNSQPLQQRNIERVASSTDIECPALTRKSRWFIEARSFLRNATSCSRQIQTCGHWRPQCRESESTSFGAHGNGLRFAPNVASFPTPQPDNTSKRNHEQEKPRARENTSKRKHEQEKTRARENTSKRKHEQEKTRLSDLHDAGF